MVWIKGTDLEALIGLLKDGVAAAGVDTVEIADAAITGAKIADDAVASAKLAAAVRVSLGKADSAVQPAALPAYLLGVAPGQKIVRNTIDVTGSATVDMSATFDNIDEVIAVLGIAPTDAACSVGVVIPAQAGEDAGKFTIHVAKNDAGSIGVSTTATTVHFIGFGTVKAS